MRESVARRLPAAALAAAVLAGCTHEASHVYDDRPSGDVWQAMKQAANQPRYADWIVIGNDVLVDEPGRRIVMSRDLKRDVVKPGLAPHREEEKWRLTATLESAEPPTVRFSSPDWAVPAHFWAMADQYFAQVRLRLAEMGPVTPPPGDPIGGAAATGRRDPRAPGHVPEKPADGGLAAP